MKKYEPIYAEDYMSYFPYAENTFSLKIFALMIDMFYFWIAMECADDGAIILCGASLLLAVIITVIVVILTLWMDNEKITVSHNGVVFENTRTGKKKGFTWENVAAVEYRGYEDYKKSQGYGIYLKKDGNETAVPSKKQRYPDYFIPEANVNRHRIAMFIPQGLHVVERRK